MAGYLLIYPLKKRGLTNIYLILFILYLTGQGLLSRLMDQVPDGQHGCLKISGLFITARMYVAG